MSGYFMPEGSLGRASRPSQSVRGKIDRLCMPFGDRQGREMMSLHECHTICNIHERT
jgi:hypothetical protein